MSRRRTTFGKLQRDRDKQAKAKAKAERRAARAEESRQAGAEAEAEPGPMTDQATVLAELAELHAAFDDGKLDLEAFEARRDELTNMLRIE